jgi:glutamyl-tRNA reductase
MHLLLVGLNHETAPLELRERAAFTAKGVAGALERLKEAGLSEVALLSTCNRTELYAMLPANDPKPLVRFLEETAGSDGLASHLYLYEGTPAARHLIRVACGLNSMILGEGQILSQTKAALQQAAEAGTLGGHLSSLFRHALAAGKRARTETGIARGAVSISNAAAHLARELFGDLRHQDALVLGAGETAEMTIRALADAGVRSVVVANRTYSHAQELAEALGGSAIRFDRMEEAMAEADIVISSTAAPHPILRRETAARVMRKRRNRPLFLIDIAVPRDIEPSVGDLPNLFLYNIDDLKQVVDESLESRAAEVAAAERIAEEELVRLMEGWRSLSLGPLLSALQERFEEIRLAETEKSGRRLSGLSESEREAVELLTRGVLKRILKEPIAQLKALGDSPEGALYMDVLRTLFGLPAETLTAAILPSETAEDGVKTLRAAPSSNGNGARGSNGVTTPNPPPASPVETPDPSREAKAPR